MVTDLIKLLQISWVPLYTIIMYDMEKSKIASGNSKYFKVFTIYYIKNNSSGIFFVALKVA